ncbi:MAG: class IIb bacteriocin, lactobin A/cerein 7B family [Kordiimonas sp.]
MTTVTNKINELSPEELNQVNGGLVLVGLVAARAAGNSIRDARNNRDTGARSMIHSLLRAAGGSGIRNWFD